MNTLTAEKRDLKTKAKKLRKEGYVIGNLFGRDIENSIPLKVDSREAAKFLKDNKKGAHITLLVDGENSRRHRKRNRLQCHEKRNNVY